MNAIVEIINAAGKAFVSFALPILIQSSVLIVILLATDVAIRKRVRAVFRYWIWLLVLVKLVLPPSLGSPVSIGRWFGEPLKAPTTAVLGLDSAPEDVPRAEPRSIAADIFAQTIPLSAAAPAPVSGDSPAAKPDVPVEIRSEPVPDVMTAPAAVASLRWQALAFLSWATIAAGLLLLLVQRMFFVRGLVAQAEEAGAAMQESLDRCRRRVGVRQEVSLRLSALAGSPAACGLLRPVILIPQSLAPRLELHDLQAILLHELAHIKRGDLWVNLAQTLLQIVYFYNPLLWLANMAIRRIREQAVDEAVLVAMGDAAQQYPETLVNIAKLAFRKRPGLSLRMVGVVESKSALAARIKHILTRPLPTSARLGLLGLIVVCVTAAVLLPMAKAATQDRPFSAEGGPLDIQLVAVRLDAGEEYRDPTGNELDWTAGILNTRLDQWDTDDARRDFIFKLPDTNEPLLFAASQHIHVTGRSATPSGGMRPMGLQEGSLLYVLPTMVPRSRPSDGRLSRVFSGSSDVRQVDLTLRYFYGPPRDPICTFTGPFEAGRPSAADGNLPHQLTWEKLGTGPVDTFRLNWPAGLAADDDVPVLIYDTNGKRHHPSLLPLSKATYVLVEGPLERVAKITIGEEPHERVFRNVVVGYPHRPARDHAAYLNQVAKILNLEKLPKKKLAQRQFRTPQEALAVLDILQGGELTRLAVEAITHGKPPVELSSLDEPTRDKVHAVAQKWAASLDLDMRSRGVQLGLLGPWPEFFDQAITLLRDDYHYLPETDRVVSDLGRIAWLLLNRWRDWLTKDQYDGITSFYNGRRVFPVLAAVGRGTGEIVLPEADRQPVALDLATGELVALPLAGPEPEKLERALKDLGKGDLLYDCDSGDRTFILVRGAKSEQARVDMGEPSWIGYLIGPQLPQTLTVTTAEDRQYDITILAADEQACTLKCAPVAADRDNGGDVPVEPEAKLTNGVTVRFLAYSQLTRGGLQWWTSASEPAAIPGVREADVDGLGTVLAFEVDPPDCQVYAQTYRGSEKDIIKKSWRLLDSSIWLFALGEQRNFVNVEVTTRVVKPPVVGLIPLTAADQGKAVEVGQFGIDKIVDLEVLSEPSLLPEVAEMMGLPAGMSAQQEMIQDLVEPAKIQFTVLPSPGSYPQVVALWDNEDLTHPVVKNSGNVRAMTYDAHLWLDRLAGVVVEASPVRESSARFRNISLTPGHATTVDVEADPQQQTVWEYSKVALGIRVFVEGLGQYQKGRGGRLPASLQGMKAYLFDEDFGWLTEHLAYIGRDGLPTNEPNVPVAYDKTLLPQGKGTYVVYEDRRVQFESPKRLAELGIAVPEEKVADVAPAVRPAAPEPESIEPVKLANGVTVEVLAYSRLGRAGLEWWTPQGARTTIPGIHEADVEGHGTLLALRMEPTPQAGVSAWFFQPPDIRYELKPVWRVNDSDIWLVPLGEGRSYANVEITAQVRDPVVVTPVLLAQPSSGGVLEIGQARIGRIADVDSVNSNSTAFTVIGLSGSLYGTGPELVAALDTSRQVHPARRVSLGRPEEEMSPFGGPQRFQVDVPVDRFAGVVVEGYSERAGTVRFGNLSLLPDQPTEFTVDVVAQEQGPWWHSSDYRSELERLGRILSAHAEENGGRYPADLSILQVFFTDEQRHWLQEHAVYIGAGKSSPQTGAMPVAYEKTLLPFGLGTYVLFSNQDVSFETPTELKSLSIVPNQARGAGSGSRR
ncbi:MAG: M56 family metallopeptidase [Sedimentisphaerales bacterium]|nr:M56 family metallopeptidase [Sedimentisphaerales bacterium]